MTGLYILAIASIVIGVVNFIILAGIGRFLMRLANSMKESRVHTAEAIDDISTMISLIRQSFDDLKKFIRSVV